MSFIIVYTDNEWISGAVKALIEEFRDPEIQANFKLSVKKAWVWEKVSVLFLFVIWQVIEIASYIAHLNFLISILFKWKIRPKKVFVSGYMHTFSRRWDIFLNFFSLLSEK